MSLLSPAILAFAFSTWLSFAFRLSMAASASLSLGSQAKNVLASSGFLIKSLACAVKLMLQVPVFAQEESSLASLIVAEGLHVIELGSKGTLLLGQDVQVVVKVSNNAEKVRVFNGNLVLGGCKVTKSQVGVVHLLVNGVQSFKHGLVGLVGGGLGPHHFVSGCTGISNLVHDLDLVLLNLALHLSQGVNLLA